MQKTNIKLLILLVAVSALFFTGCKKKVVSNSSDSNATGQTNHANPKPENAVHIVATFDFSTFPNVYGTFTTTGALGDQNGTAFMAIGPLTPTGKVAHCVVVLTFQDGSTISIKQECEFNNAQVYPDNKGQWQITGGTGAYAGIKGNGITTMPPLQEDMTGVIQ